jgi:hypothetical protein
VRTCVACNAHSIILFCVYLQAMMRTSSSSSSNVEATQQTRDPALSGSLAKYEQAVHQSQQLQAALQLVLASGSVVQQQEQAAGNDTQAAAAAPSPSAACNGSSMPGIATSGSTTQQQQSIQAAFTLLQAAELEYANNAKALQAECSEVQQLLRTLHSQLCSLSARSQQTQKLAGDVPACSAALQAQLMRCRARAAAAAPMHQQQHTELLARQQHARALQQLRAGASKQLTEVGQVKLCLEKVQDYVEDLEYALKKAAKKDSEKVPGLQLKLSTAEQELARLQGQLAATQQLLSDGQLQMWYPELQQQLSELLLNEYGPAAAAGAIGSLAAAQLVIGQAGAGRLPCRADYRSLQVLHRTADKTVRKQEHLRHARNLEVSRGSSMLDSCHDSDVGTMCQGFPPLMDAGVGTALAVCMLHWYAAACCLRVMPAALGKPLALTL